MTDLQVHLLSGGVPAIMINVHQATLRGKYIMAVAGAEAVASAGVAARTSTAGTTFSSSALGALESGRAGVLAIFYLEQKRDQREPTQPVVKCCWHMATNKHRPLRVIANNTGM